MKKRTVISLVVAMILILVGAVLLVLSASQTEQDAWMPQLTQRQISVTENVDSVVIKTGDCNVTFVPFEGAIDPYLVLQEKEKISHNVKVQDGVLKIEMVDNRQWLDYIGISWKSMEMTVYLPQKQYSAVQVTTNTGDIKMPEAFSANVLRLHTDTGDIRCDALAQELVNCKTDTGEIYVSKVAPAMLELQSDTGKVTAQDVNCQLITCESDTGDVIISTLAVADYLQVFTNTGDVQIQKADANRINIETGTGNVHVPVSFKQRDCRIESDTGNIRFK